MAYQAQVQTGKQYEPSAPVLPSAYEGGPQPGPSAAASYQQSSEVDQDVIEITDPNDGVSGPPAPGPVQRRSRSRSRTYQP
jgi:hypothetical protein